MDLQSIEGVALIRQRPEEGITCHCCNGQPHVYGAILDLQDWHMRDAKNFKQIDDWVHEYLYDRRFTVGGKRIKVTIEIVEDDTNEQK